MPSDTIQQLPVQTGASPIEAALSERGSLQSAGAAFHALADSMPQMIWSTLPNGDHDYYNARWYEFTGVPVGSTDGEGWAGMFHPDDQPAAWQRWSHSLASGEPYEVEYRLRRHDGIYRWTVGRAQPVRDADGAIVRWIGTCTDIEDAKSAAEHNEVLSRELSHRIKNIFAVVGALVRMTARARPEFVSAADELSDRIASLARAHEFARPHSEESRPEPVALTLRNLLASILAPYPAANDGRISVAGGDFPIDERAATPMALFAHELATNALKYGALSTDEGTIAITISREGNDVKLVWMELGAPTTEPNAAGFGSRLVTLAVEQQMGGTMSREWRRDGLTVTASIAADRLRGKA